MTRAPTSGWWARLASVALVAAVATLAIHAAPVLARPCPAAAGTGMPVVEVAPDQRSACEAPYRGLRPDDQNGRQALPNPHRGLRLQLAFDADVVTPADVLAAVAYEEARYGAGTKVAQLHLHLDDYIGTGIPTDAIQRMQAVFDTLKALGYTVVLGLVYDHSQAEAQVHDYGLADIRLHLASLKPLLARNRGLIAALEAGFLGAWGEWGPNVTNIQQQPGLVDDLIAAIADAAPGVPIMMRYPWHREMVDAAMRPSIGFHNDYFAAGYTDTYDYYEPTINQYWNGQTHTGNFFDSVVAASPNVMVDGEMAWETSLPKGNYDPAIPLDGLVSAVRLESMHYTTFSEVHNPGSFAAWRAQLLSEEDLTDRRLPADPAYFHDASGGPVSRNVFEYIRDHLGYRLRLTGAAFGDSAGGSLPVTLNLVNDGFSAPHDARAVQLVLLDEHGEIVLRQATAADWTSWQGLCSAEGNVPCAQPTHAVQGTLDLTGLPAGRYQLGLWLPAGDPDLQSDPRYAVRLANGIVGWSDRLGVNVLATVDLARGGPPAPSPTEQRPDDGGRPPGGGPPAPSSTERLPKKPKAEVTIEAPRWARRARTATIVLKVRNPSGVPLRTVRVCAGLPAGLAYRGSRPRARLRRGRFCWTVARLAPRATVSRRLTVRTLCSARARLTIRAGADGPTIRTVAARRTVRVRGVCRPQPGGVTG
jgi:hypothetical protein